MGYGIWLCCGLICLSIRANADFACAAIRSCNAGDIKTQSRTQVLERVDIKYIGKPAVHKA